MSAAHSLYIIRFVCLCNEAFDCLLLLGCLLGALMLAVLSFVNWPQNVTKNNKTHTEKETQNTNEMTKMTNHKIKTE